MNFLLIFLNFSFGFWGSISFWIILILIIILIATSTSKKTKSESVHTEHKEESHGHDEHEEHGEHEHHEPANNSSVVAWVCSIIFVIGLVYLCFVFFNHYSKKEKVKDTTTIEQPKSTFLPPVYINSSFCYGTTIVAGYNTIFHCNQPYQIKDKNGKTYNGEANTDVDIGVSLANSTLYFRTRNGTETTMNIELVKN